MLKSVTLFAALAASAVSLHAVETQTWQQATQEEFAKGSLNKLSIRSDGRLMLAPVFTELYDSSVPYLWTVAEDSKGNVYVGGGGPGGGGARLVVIDPAGKPRELAQLDGFEVHAIAIDSRDRVYAATSPDGKIYRIAAEGKAEVFFDPQAKYIWAMAFDSKGDLFAATGDRGEIFRIKPDGTGSKFFSTDETHARSLAIDAQDNIIVGTEPGGLILRVAPSGEGFVLYQAKRREVTAVAVARDGSIYAAAVGTKPAAAPPIPPPSAVPAPPQAPPNGPAPSGQQQQGQQRPAGAPPPTFAPQAPGLTGGSEVYRISPDGYPRRVWNHTQDIVYSIGFDRDGLPVLGTGNQGNIYRLDSDVLSTLLLNAAPTQVTALASARSGAVYAVTGNIGKVFRIGPGLETEGSLESDVLDASGFTQWGRLSWKGNPANGKLTFETRSGNLDRPQKNWSSWAPVALNSDGGRIASPPARFLQYRVTLRAASAASPSVHRVEVAYKPRNVAPVVEIIEATPANYRFPPQSLTLTPTTNITLPPLAPSGRRPATPTIATSSGAQSMQYAKGYVGARWHATDENGDDLLFKVEIRGVGERDWKLLKDNLKDRQLSWDSTAFPDGEYLLRITASDSPDNPPDQALTAVMESDPLLIDNTPPGISGLAAAPQGNRVEVRWRASDALNPINRAEYSVNGGDWTVVEPTTGISDSRDHEYLLPLDRQPNQELTIAVRVTDAFDNQSVEKIVVR